MQPELAPRRAFILGSLFGLCYFAPGLYWIAIAFFVDAERFGALAVPAVAGLSLLLGTTFGLGAALVQAARLRSLAARACALAVAWALAEIARGQLPFSFPWNPVAIAWTAHDATLQGVAWLGSTGLSLVTVAAFAAAAGALEPGPRRARLAWLAPAATLTLALLLGGEARLRLTPPPADAGPALRIVQANIPQSLKWDPELREGWFERHLELSQAQPGPVPPLLVWPESAVPYQIEREPVVRELIAGVLPADGVAIVGGNHYELEAQPRVAHNSVFALGADQDILARYDKVDLVPFGEFLPLRWLFASVGLEKLTPGTIDFEPGPGRQTIVLPGLPAFSPLICYEAIFPARAAPDEPRPAWLLNATNDAWFGISSGPYQHLAMARMRAVEEGLPLVRAANSGISVVTDAFGRVLGRLPLGAAGVLDADLPGALPAASFARRHAGWWAAALLLAAAALAAALEATHRRAADS